MCIHIYIHTHAHTYMYNIPTKTRTLAGRKCVEHPVRRRREDGAAVGRDDWGPAYGPVGGHGPHLWGGIWWILGGFRVWGVGEGGWGGVVMKGGWRVGGWVGVMNRWARMYTYTHM